MVRADRPAGRSLEAVVGRDDQFVELMTQFDAVIDHGSRLVLLGGEAGVGKTTLLEVFVTALGGGSLAARRVQVLHGQCVALGDEGLPYAPIAGALRELTNRFGRDQVLEWAGPSSRGLGTLLPDLGSVPAESSGEARLRLFEAVARLLEQASAEAPLVVVIEDIHWADESTRHLLRFLAGALTDASILVIASFRTDELTRRHPLRPFLAELGRLPQTTRLDVPSLDRAAVGDLLSRLLGHQPSAAVIDTVHRRSEGIPYFVEELAGSAARGCIEMPDTLRDALSVRIQALSEAAQRVLELIAVAGVRVDHNVLEAVAATPAESLEAGLREAIDAAVLRADETGYAFRHALLREVAHDDLLPGRHARLHARFAEILEQRPELLVTAGRSVEIAHHYAAAHEATKAFDWSIRAAGSDARGYPEALKLYERALELWDQAGDAEAIAGPRAGLLEQAAQMAANAGEPERALALITSSLAETPQGPGPERANRLRQKSALLSGLLRSGTVEAAEESLAALPPGSDVKLRAAVLSQLAIALMLSGRRERAIAVADEAARQAVAAGSANLESNAINSRGSALFGLGREQEGLADLSRSGELARDDTRTVLRFYTNYSDALHLAGHFAEAVEQAMAGIEVARALGLERSLGSMLAGNAAEPLLARGEWDRAERLIARALELDPPAYHKAQLRQLHAWQLTWQGRLEAADAVLAGLRPLIGLTDSAPQYAVGVIRTDAEHALAVGQPERAWPAVTMFLEHTALFGAAVCWPMYATAAAVARRLDQATGVTQPPDTRVRLVRQAVERATPSLAAPLWATVVRAELCDDVESWREAYRRSSAPEVPAHLAPYAGLRLAQHLARQSAERRDRAEARAVLADSAERAAGLGAGLLTTRLATLAQRLGLATAPTEPARPFADLTPREFEVLGLLSEGRTNGEIGSALFISTKTASVHVSNILAKLRVASRGEAAALAHRHGLLPA